jgi:hypothetical protein
LAARNQKLRTLTIRKRKTTVRHHSTSPFSKPPAAQPLVVPVVVLALEDVAALVPEQGRVDQVVEMAAADKLHHRAPELAAAAEVVAAALAVAEVVLAEADSVAVVDVAESEAAALAVREASAVPGQPIKYPQAKSTSAISAN